MLEFILQIIGELLIEVVAEVVAELGFHALSEPFRRSPDPVIAAFGFLLIGTILGALSLIVFPTHLTPAGTWRIVNALVSPVIAGLCMVLVGAWRAARGEPVLRIDKFAYGYLFALGLAMVRFKFAH